jgi:hypothetical protein
VEPSVAADAVRLLAGSKRAADAALPGPGLSHLQGAQQQAVAQQLGTVQGNQHLQRVVASDGPSSDLIQRDLLDTLGDVFNLRENEAELDEWEDYQDAMQELAAFRSTSHVAENFQSTTRLGLFDAIYQPSSGTLRIVVRCKFNFVNGSAAEFPRASAADLTWADEDAKNAWKVNFLSTVNSAWSGNHIFYCTKDWWESLRATVVVNAVDSEVEPHFVLSITKIPPGEFRGSSVTSPTVVPFLGPLGPGTGDFDSEDLTTIAKPGGRQTAAIHEMGHILGVDDEYVGSGPGAPSHSPMVQSEFGTGVAKGTDGRVMSGGNDIQPEHGVTFLAALREATDMTEWTMTMCPVPRPIPTNPRATEGMGDFPVPSGDTRVA